MSSPETDPLRLALDGDVLPVWALMFALRMSPLERCFSSKLLVIRADTVPFPDPGGPMMTTRKILRRDISGSIPCCKCHRLASDPPTRPASGCAARTELALSSPRSAQRSQEWARLLRPACVFIGSGFNFVRRRRNPRREEVG